MVEHDLAKVGVAGSSPVFRSESSRRCEGIFFETRCPGGGPDGYRGGRHVPINIGMASNTGIVLKKDFFIIIALVVELVDTSRLISGWQARAVTVLKII